ncbi:hypothetical protein AB0I51_05445 [Streptomyces sp. NPDC050549]|uniref:hypothetical protein n=1 Tax=Streptomyces sp. NPDC050549 TaxID=3155406 RepID=UPI0034461917
MSPTKPTSPKDTGAPKKQRVFPADFDEFVTETAAGLGDGWTVDADSHPHPGLSAYLAHPDGRRIGIKHIWRGTAVQTWALDVPPREYEDQGDAEAYAYSLKQLTPDTRYNVGVCFTNNPPAATTARNIRTGLLPAFDGRRPRLRAFPKKRSRRAPAAQKNEAATTATTNSNTTRATDQSEPQKTTAKGPAPAKTPRRTANKAQPTEQKAQQKKQPSTRRSRRSTAAAARTTKPKDTKPQQTQPPEETANK